MNGGSKKEKKRSSGSDGRKTLVLLGEGRGEGREEVNQLSEAVLQCYTSAFRESSGSN